MAAQVKMWVERSREIAASKGLCDFAGESVDRLYRCKVCRTKLVVGCGMRSNCNDNMKILCGMCVCNGSDCRERHKALLANNVGYESRCGTQGCRTLIPGSIHGYLAANPQIESVGVTIEGQNFTFSNCVSCRTNRQPAVYCDIHGRHDRHRFMWECDDEDGRFHREQENERLRRQMLLPENPYTMSEPVRTPAMSAVAVLIRGEERKRGEENEEEEEAAMFEQGWAIPVEEDDQQKYDSYIKLFNLQFGS